ncbi:hypothetical protein DPMN_005613 [Dreissena polymorpha]|uniref:Uncharacterized protein n=1 Tax=Dreissena polymorpha TaxID=45954 RepID=A0A9D4RU22_DREPO|nr:hypothetical protein DPMN_005613 [Dreissena polymorpha]
MLCSPTVIHTWASADASFELCEYLPPAKMFGTQMIEARLKLLFGFQSLSVVSE